MNWEAFFIIGGLALILGAILYIPGRWWARRKLAESSPESNARLHITPIGYIYFTVLIGGMLFAFSQQYFAPDSEIGKLVSSSFGRFVLLGGVAAIGFVVERILQRAGMNVTVRKRRNGANNPG